MPPHRTQQLQAAHRLSPWLNPRHSRQHAGARHLTCSRPSRLRTSGASCAPGTRPAASDAPRPATAVAAERPLCTLHAWPSSLASTGSTSLGPPGAAVNPKATPSGGGALAARAPSPFCSRSGEDSSSPSESPSSPTPPGEWPAGGAGGAGGGAPVAAGCGKAHRMRSAAQRCACERAASAGSSAGRTACQQVHGSA